MCTTPKIHVKARDKTATGLWSALLSPSICSLSPAYLSWLQPFAELPSAEPLCEQEEQEDFRGLGCHSDGRLFTETSIRSWGTVVNGGWKGGPAVNLA